jgi:hypothetical protein
MREPGDLPSLVNKILPGQEGFLDNIFQEAFFFYADINYNAGGSYEFT